MARYKSKAVVHRTTAKNILRTCDTALQSPGLWRWTGKTILAVKRHSLSVCKAGLALHLPCTHTAVRQAAFDVDPTRYFLPFSRRTAAGVEGRKEQ